MKTTRNQGKSQPFHCKSKNKTVMSENIINKSINDYNQYDKGKYTKFYLKIDNKLINSIDMDIDIDKEQLTKTSEDYKDKDKDQISSREYAKCLVKALKEAIDENELVSKIDYNTKL